MRDYLISYYSKNDTIVENSQQIQLMNRAGGILVPELMYSKYIKMSFRTENKLEKDESTRGGRESTVCLNIIIVDR